MSNTTVPLDHDSKHPRNGATNLADKTASKPQAPTAGNMKGYNKPVVQHVVKPLSPPPPKPRPK